MDTARDLIISRIKELGLTMSDLSLQVGKNHAYWSAPLRRAPSPRLPGREARPLGPRIVTGNTLFPIPNRPSRRGFTMATRGAHARGTVASWLGISGLRGAAVPELVGDA